MTTFAWKKWASTYVFPEVYLFPGCSLKLPLLAQASVSVRPCIPSPLFAHHPVLPWVPYCFCLFSCSTHGGKTYCLFCQDSRVVVFILCCHSLFFFSFRSSPSWLMFFITNPPALNTTPQSPTKCQSSVKVGAKQSRHDSFCGLCVRPPAPLYACVYVYVCVRVCVCKMSFSWITNRLWQCWGRLIKLCTFISAQEESTLKKNNKQNKIIALKHQRESKCLLRKANLTKCCGRVPSNIFVCPLFS